MQFSKEISA